MRALKRLVLLAAGAATLAACGSGGGAGAAPGGMSSPTACSNCGGAMVTLTDAPGDFLSYIVNVVSLQLTRSDGSVVQTLPVATTVDFAQLVNLSEVVSAAQIPEGRYVSASITLDYSSATIVVDSGSGGVTIAANDIIDGATSQPLAAPNPTRMTLSLSLPSNAPLVISHGTVANLALDFNLAASDAIGPSATNPTTVTVNPVLTGSLVPDATRQLRVRGALVSVDTAAASYTVDVHPFDDDGGDSGRAAVATTASTSYTIDGTSLTGSAGLAQLATLPAGTMTVAFGTLDKSTMTFTASTVLAGSSVAGNGRDGVQGTVLSRSGDTLTIANGVETHADVSDDVQYVRQVTATIGAGTAVSELGRSGAFTIQDISVGQRIELSGKLGSDASGNATLDATAGAAILMPTRLTGTVSTAASGLVTLALQSIDGQSPSEFDFSGTGAMSAEDAVATAYTVALPPALSTGSISAGAPARFLGFVSPFGSAPPDFNALTIVDYANAEVEMHWSAPGETAPFATLTDAQVSVAATVLGATDEFDMRYAFTEISASSLGGGLNFAPDASASNPSYVIVHRVSEKSDAFTSFNDFSTALTADLNGATGMIGLAAAGPYDAATSTVSADQMIVMLND